MTLTRDMIIEAEKFEDKIKEIISERDRYKAALMDVRQSFEHYEISHYDNKNHRCDNDQTATLAIELIDQALGTTAQRGENEG